MPSANYIVVGGGIVGCSAAYLLARAGHNVTLFEKDSVASHASGFAFGVVLPPLSVFDEPANSLDNVSARLHREFAKTLPNESDVKPELIDRAAVHLALSDDEESALRGAYERLGRNPDLRWLSRGELSHIEARIGPEVRGGLYLGNTFEVEPYKLTLALSQAAERRGAATVNRNVESLIIEGGRAKGVVAGGEEYRADGVIAAPGPWASAMFEGTGLRVPISPMKGQILRLQTDDPPLRVSFWWTGGDYVGPKSDGLTWAGTTQEHVGFDESVTDEARRKITDSVVRLFPYLESARLVKQTACLRPISPDGMPVVGTAAGIEGLVVATGAGRVGIAIGPGMGKAAADLLVKGSTDVDIEGLGPDRFN